MTITGGQAKGDDTGARSKVTRYKMPGISEELPPLKSGRYFHACGEFTTIDGTIVCKKHAQYEDHFRKYSEFNLF